MAIEREHIASQCGGREPALPPRGGAGKGCRLLETACALGATLLVLPASASAAPRTCKDLISQESLKDLATPQTRTVDVAQGCAFTNLTFKLSYVRTLTIDRLTLSGDGLLGDGAAFPPVSLRAEAQGIRFAPDIKDTHARYLMQVVQKPFSVRLSYDWDEATHQVHVHDISLDSPWLGDIGISLDLDAPTPEKAAVRRISVRLDNRSLVESMLMPLLVGLIPADEDPAIEIPKIQEKAEKDIQKMPASLVDPSSREALIAFTRDFPHPTGHFEEAVGFATPISLDDVWDALKDNNGKAATLLHNAHIQARYVPQPEQPQSLPVAPHHDGSVDGRPPTTGMVNPASLYCRQKKGRTEMRTSPSGDVTGYCRLPDGTVIEEWALFRRDHPARQ